ncbi:calcium homeostasis modulator protein 3 isoform X1 [Pseudophryne corroboree]|uniref:calcium homeostasis modulator protein 3 isoform X1 n=1 Tax=Pseudophryne corroboree TaxID=495146 RepID=UPI0030812DB0
MERVIKYLKSGTDAKMNIICGLIILTSMVTYKAYEFKCPCLPGYNKLYGLMILIAPPLIFFFVGIIVSQYCGILTIECSRPDGNREKNKKVLRQLFIAMISRALAAPLLWILVCLLDGKLFVCAFSETVDPEQFGGFADYSKYDTAYLLAQVPCKNFEILHRSSTRKAISRFLKFLSQGIGCILVVTFIVLAAVARIVTPFFNRVASLQLLYWSRQSVIMIDEWQRPTGRRKKDLAIVRYMCTSVLTRAMVAPVVWILTTLLDGKCFVCAFSGSVDPDKFPGFANNTSPDMQFLLYKVPCKEDVMIRNNTSRKAVSRYLKCWSQALGWSILLCLIVLVFLARSLKPCFDQTAFLQTRYWSNYIDIEQKIFDETCCEHARDFAHKCILHFFQSMHNEMKVACFTKKTEEDEEDHLHGITDQEHVNKLLKSWYQSKPPLSVNHPTQRQHVKGKSNGCCFENHSDKQTDV